MMNTACKECEHHRVGERLVEVFRGHRRKKIDLCATTAKPRRLDGVTGEPLEFISGTSGWTRNEEFTACAHVRMSNRRDADDCSLFRMVHP